MKKICIAALSFSFMLSATADPLMQWVSDNAIGGPGTVVDANGVAIPQASDWVVELVDTSNNSVLHSTTAGFQTAPGQFVETPDATDWNGISVKTVIYNANHTSAATLKAEFSSTLSLSWDTDPVPDAVVLYNAGSVDMAAWQAIQHPPIAYNGSDTVNEDGFVDIALVATDADDDPLTYSVVTQPVNGSVSISGNVATYTPDAAYYGPDSFTFKANDGTEESNVATVDITVNPVAPLGAPASDTAVFGTVSGMLADAYDNNGLYQVITEAVSGDTSALEHQWSFNVTPDELVTFYVEAHHTANSEGDDFVFAYSTNGTDWIDMVTVTKTVDDNTLQFFSLPTQTSGTVYVRVLDTDRTGGNTALDAVYVDTIFIYSEASTVAPGMAHTPVPADEATDVPISQELSWVAGLMSSSHDLYFGTSASPAFVGNLDGTTYDPGTLLEGTTYYWAVDAVNNSGTTLGPIWSFTTVDAEPAGWVELFYDDFEGGFGNWVDGGTDCLLYKGGTYAHQGSHAVNLQDDTGTSVMSTVDLALSGNSEIKVDFWYYPRSMDNSNEDFWLQISTDGGSSFSTVKAWAKGIDFENNQFYSESFVISGHALTDQTRLRFRCDASGNADDIYIDEVRVSVQ